MKHPCISACAATTLVSGDYVNRLPSAVKVRDSDSSHLVDGICLALLSEGFLKRDGYLVVGGCAINDLDTAINMGNKDWNGLRRIFSRPVQKEISLLDLYEKMLTFRFGKLGLSEVLAGYLPESYPLCRYLVIEFGPIDPNVAPEDSNDWISRRYDSDQRRFHLKINSDKILNDFDMQVPKTANRKHPLPRGGAPAGPVHYREVKDPPEEATTGMIDKAIRSLSKLGLAGQLEHDVLTTFLPKEHGEEKRRRESCALHLYLAMQGKILGTDSCYIGIPLRALLKGDAALLGALWLIYNKRWGEIEKQETPRIDQLYREVVIPINQRMQSLVIIRQSELMLEAQTKAAAAAILSRNMSHHIGSHVSVRSGLPDLQKRMGDLYPKRNGFFQEELDSLREPLDAYIRQKADFLAEIATEPAGSSVSMFLLKDVIAPLLANTVLMDSLCANESLRYRPGGTDSRLQMKVRLPGDKAFRSEVVPYIPVSRDENGRWNPHIPGRSFLENDRAVLLPGTLGAFAFYGILENLIRNAAKHNRDKFDQDPTKNLELYIDVRDEDEDAEWYVLDFFDNCTDPEAPTGGQRLSEKLKEDLDEQIVGPGGSVRHKAWGMAELVICANLLRGASNYSNAARPPWDDPPVKVIKLRAKEDLRLTSVGGLKKRCVFRLRLRKARQALFVGEDFSRALGVKDDEGVRMAFLSAGISFQDNWTQAERDEGESLSSYQFLVYSGDDVGKPHRGRLPFRIINVCGESGINDHGVWCEKDARALLGTEKEPEKVIVRLWRAWSHRWLSGTESKGLVGVYLDESQEENDVTRAWQANVKTHNDSDPSVQVEVGFGNKPPMAPVNGVGNPVVLLDRHARALKELKSVPRAYEILEKGNGDFTTIFYQREHGVWTFPYELFEAGMLKILVLDERILERSLELAPKTASSSAERLLGIGMQPLFWHVARWANVIIGTHLVVQGESRLFEKEGVLRKGVDDSHLKTNSIQAAPFLDAWGRTGKERSCPCPIAEVDLGSAAPVVRIVDALQGGGSVVQELNRIDLVLIHQGILDTVRDQSGPDIQKKTISSIKKLAPWFVVESGRGIPPEVQDSEDKFLSFSSLEAALRGGYVSKLSLVRQLMTLSRAGNHGGI